MPDVDPQTGLELFEWCGQRRYKCPKTWEGGNRCEFDHYDPREVIQHAAEPHTLTGKAPKIQRTVSPLVDPDGRQIVHDEAPEKFKDYRFKED